MCRLTYIDFACGCADPRAVGSETCMSLYTANRLRVPFGTDLRSMLFSNCFLSMGLGVIRERVEHVCPMCSLGLIPPPMVLRPIGQMWAPTTEERWLSEMAWLRNQTTLNEEGSVIAAQRLSEERRWQEEAMAARDARGERKVWMEVVMGPDASEEGTPGTPWNESDSDEWSISAGVLEDAGELETTDEWSLSTDVLEAAGELEPSEEGSWSDWSVTSSELVQAALEQAEEDAEVEARMAQEDRELSEELIITLAEADDEFNSLLTATIYNWYLHLRCNKVVHETYKLERRRSNTLEGGAMPAIRWEDSVLVAGMDDAEMRNKEAVEAPASGGVKKGKKVSFNIPGENDQSLTRDMPTASAILDAGRPGAMNAETVPVLGKLIPRHRREKIVSGIEVANFDQEVADACKEGVEHLREGGKIYLAIKAAMGDGCVGTYQFVTDEVAHYITAFVLSTVVEILYPSLGEIRALRGERAITAVEAAGDAALVVLEAKQAAKKATTGSWAEDSSKALAVVWSGGAWTQKTFQAFEGATGSAPESVDEDSAGTINDAESPLPPTLETPLEPDSSQISNRGRDSERGAARGRSRGKTRGRGRAREKLSGRPQVAGDAAASGAGVFALGLKNADITALPAVDTHLGLEGPGSRRRSLRRGGGGGVTQGFVESLQGPEARILPPILDKSLMTDSSRLGKGNRGIAPKPTGHEQQIEGFARGYAGTPTPPKLDKSLVTDNSQLGKRNRTTAGSYQQPIESFARDSAESPMQPRLDKSLMADNSQLGKRKRESEGAPVTTGSHQQATDGTVGGYAEGSQKSQRLTRSTLRQLVELDASNLSAGRRGRRRGVKRAREN